jgi:hypothetical protein
MIVDHSFKGNSVNDVLAAECLSTLLDENEQLLDQVITADVVAQFGALLRQQVGTCPEQGHTWLRAAHPLCACVLPIHHTHTPQKKADRFVNLLAATCSVNDKPIISNQRLITELLFSPRVLGPDSPERLVIPFRLAPTGVSGGARVNAGQVSGSSALSACRDPPPLNEIPPELPSPGGSAAHS